MRRAFRFSVKTTIFVLLLAGGMIRASYWQWTRYGEKQLFLARMEQNLAKAPVPFSMLAAEHQALTEQLHRRVIVEGEYDFAHEVVLQNRRYENNAGVHVMTPLRITGTQDMILVNRGFIRLHDSDRAIRSQFQHNGKVRITALIKPSEPRRTFSPRDSPAGPAYPWVDRWLRVDLDAMQQQMPAPLLPVYLEIIDGAGADTDLSSQLVDSHSGRDELFFLPSRQTRSEIGLPDDPAAYPIPVFNTVSPPIRHLGYVYEWAIMAVATLVIGVILQFSRV